MDKPNFVLITIDTLRYDRVGYAAERQNLTPNLDAFAERSIVFQKAFTGGSWTQAAFPVLLTSSSASGYGGCLGPLSSDRPSPIAALARCGYQTAGFSTSPLVSRAYGYDRGFGHFRDLIPEDRDPSLRRLRGGEKALRWPVTHKLAALAGRKWRPARLYQSAAAVNDAIIDWTDDASQPFFVWGHYMDVHWPYHLEDHLNTPDEIAAAWQDVAKLYRVNRQGEELPEALRQRFVRLYEESVRFTDHQIGRLFHWLEESGAMENTVVIVTSDHGEEFMERKHWGHFEVNLHDEIMRVPLIIYTPGVKAQTIADSVRLLDIMPTILELAGCSPEPSVEGRSMSPIWKEEAGPYEVKTAMCEMWRENRHIVAVRSDCYKYIWDSHGEARLFDLRDDPLELEDIAALNKPVASSFQKEVDAHLEFVKSTTPENGIGELVPSDDVRQRLRDLGYVD